MNSGFQIHQLESRGEKLPSAAAPTEAAWSSKKEQMYGRCGREKHCTEIAGSSAFFNLLWARHAGGERWEGLEPA